MYIQVEPESEVGGGLLVLNLNWNTGNTYILVHTIWRVFDYRLLRFGEVRQVINQGKYKVGVPLFRLYHGFNSSLSTKRGLLVLLHRLYAQFYMTCGLDCWVVL